MKSEKRPTIKIFKIGNAYYFKHSFDDPELLRELKPYYEKKHSKFKMATAGKRNKVMEILDKKGYDIHLK